MRPRAYDQEFKEMIIRLHLEGKRTISSLSKEYGISPSTISRWLITQRNRTDKEMHY